MSSQENSLASWHDASQSDTHMQSPAYSTPGGESTASMTPVPNELHSTSTAKHRAPRDGYLYEPYNLDLGLGKDGDEDESISAHQASHKRILELRGIERRIVQLLETAGKAIQILSDDDAVIPVEQLARASVTSPDAQKAAVEEYAEERATEFEALATAYTDLVNQIQVGMRRHFHYLTKAGITASQIPFKNVLYGEERELETWLNAVDVISESATDMVRKANAYLEEGSISASTKPTVSVDRV